MDDFLARIKAVSAEQRASATWSSCGEDVAVYTLGGLLVGGALAFTLVRGRPFPRGLLTGMGAGVGAGVATAKCNDRFVALQTVSKPARTEPLK